MVQHNEAHCKAKNWHSIVNIYLSFGKLFFFLCLKLEREMTCLECGSEERWREVRYMCISIHFLDCWCNSDEWVYFPHFFTMRWSKLPITSLIVLLRRSLSVELKVSSVGAIFHLCLWQPVSLFTTFVCTVVSIIKPKCHYIDMPFHLLFPCWKVYPIGSTPVSVNLCFCLGEKIQKTTRPFKCFT